MSEHGRRTHARACPPTDVTAATVAVTAAVSEPSGLIEDTTERPLLVFSASPPRSSMAPGMGAGERRQPWAGEERLECVGSDKGRQGWDWAGGAATQAGLRLIGRDTLAGAWNPMPPCP